MTLFFKIQRDKAKVQQKEQVIEDFRAELGAEEAKRKEVTQQLDQSSDKQIQDLEREIRDLGQKIRSAESESRKLKAQVGFPTSCCMRARACVFLSVYFFVERRLAYMTVSSHLCMA